MKRLILCLALALLAGCASRPTDQSDKILSMQIVDRNGMAETLSNKERLSSYQTTDFTKPQPYQKVLRVYGRNLAGQSSSKITSYHDNGLLWQYLEVVDGRAHGLYQEWFPNGQLKVEAHLIEGVPDIHDLAQATWVFEGDARVWDEQGRPAAEFYYEKGLLQKTARYFFSSGRPQKIIPYEQGEENGIVQAFNESGDVIEEIAYIKGQKHGTAFALWNKERFLSKEEWEEDRLVSGSYYDEKGNLLSEVKAGNGKMAQFNDGRLSSLITFVKGIPQGEVQQYTPKGALHISYCVKDGMKNGEEWEYYLPQEGDQKPRPKLCLHWHDDKMEGQAKTWYPNGQIESQREVNGSKKHGVSFAWYKNGDLMLVEEYENDLLVKGSYYKKGDKQAVSKIESGKGIASLYSGDGIFLRKVSYEKGRPLLNDDPDRR